MATIDFVSEKREGLSAWRRKVARLTQQEIADKLGISFGQYRNYEYRSDQLIPPEILATLMRMGYQGEPVNLMKLRPANTGTIKLYGGVTAGYAEENREYSVTEYPIAPEFAMPYYSASFCEGNSMMPLLQPGDVLIFRDHPSPITNHVFAVRVSTQPQPLVKELYFEGGRWNLRSWNDGAEPITEDSYQLLGYLVGISSRDGGLKIGPYDSGLTRRMIEETLLSRVQF